MPSLSSVPCMTSNHKHCVKQVELELWLTCLCVCARARMYVCVGGGGVQFKIHSNVARSHTDTDGMNLPVI